MSDKLKVAVLGGTGMVGQRFISIIENHPWFEVKTIAASPRSAGQTYEESVGKRWKMDTPMPESVKNIVIKDVTDVKAVSEDVDFVLSAVNMSKDEIKAIEEEYAKTETPVVSRKRDLELPTALLPLSQTALSRAIHPLLLHGRNMSPTRWLPQPIRQFQVPARTLRSGLRW